MRRNQPPIDTDPRAVRWAHTPFAAAVLLSLTMLRPAEAQAQQLQRLSEPEDPFALGTLADGFSEGCRMAAGRWTVFASRAANLVAEDRNASQDIFLRDRQTGVVERISVDSLEVEARGLSSSPDVSDDGRFVAFVSQAVLAPGATAGVAGHVYLRDRANGTTTLLSRTFDGSPIVGSSFSPRIDGSGTSVVFGSNVGNLVPGDTNGSSDVFAYDIGPGTLTLLSSDASGVIGNAPSSAPDVADGGSRVVFTSDANNLVAGDTNAARDIFLKDRTTGSISRLSVDPSGVGGNGFSDLPSINAAGTLVAFASFASNLVPGDTANRQDVFVWDEAALPRISRASLGAGGIEGDNHSRSPSIGQGGRWLVFDSAATNLVPGQIVTPSMQPFLVDRQTGTIVAVLSSAGQTTVGPASLDSTDTRLCLSSTAAFDPADANGSIRDVSSRAVASASWTLESRTGTPVPAPAANGASSEPELSADGRFVVFSSSATNLDAAATGRTTSSDVYWLDRSTGAIERWPLAPGGLSPNGGSGSVSVSADGRWLAFASSANNLATGATGAVHTYRLDRTTGASLALTIAPTGVGGGDRPQISDDAQSIVFQSSATTLVPGDTNNVRDVFLWRAASGLQRISVSTGGAQADRESRLPRIAGQGGHVVFVSGATGLVAAASGGFDHVYRVETATGVVRRVSETAAGVAGDGHSRVADLSADGRYVALVTDAGNLAVGGRTGADVLRWDASNGSFVDAAALLPVDEAVDPDSVRISDDGRYVVLGSIRQVGAVFTENVWRADLDAGVLLLMSSNGGSNRNAGRIQGLAVDSAGNVLFAADDDALLTGDGNGAYDVYRASTASSAGMLGLDAGASLLTVTEGVDTDAVVAVVRSGGTVGAVSANFATQPGTASSVLDFGVRNGVAGFANGANAAQLIVIPIVDDNTVEGPEQFSVTLTNPVGGVALGPITTLTITILDNDVPPPTDAIFGAGFED